mgnify:CR=1 FL=1
MNFISNKVNSLSTFQPPRPEPLLQPNESITTIKIKDEYGPIFENDASGAAQAAIVPTDPSDWSASLKADTSSSHEAHAGHIDLDTVYLTIDKPKAFDNVDGEITNFDYVLTPANRLEDVSYSTGSVTASSSLVLKFKLKILWQRKHRIKEVNPKLKLWLIK